VLGVALRRPRRRTGRAALSPLAVGLTTALAVGAAGPAAQAASADRGYELVTPGAKNGSEVLAGERTTRDGETLAFTTFGTVGDAQSSIFGNTFVARRGAAGWSTLQLSMAPVVPNPGLFDAAQTSGFTPDLHTTYVSTVAPLVAGDTNAANDVYAITDTGAPRWVSDGPGAATAPGTDVVYEGSSDDGRHVIVNSPRPLVAGPTPGTAQVYDVGPGGATLVSVVSGAPSTSAAALGSRAAGEISGPSPYDRTAVSADGRRIVFNAGGQLYDRIDGTTTVLVSASQRTGDPAGTPSPTPARFQGAAVDGSRVIFTAKSPLTDDAAPAGGLYAYDVADGTLHFLAAAGTSTTEVVRVSDDGRRVFYVTNTQLDGVHGTAGQANVWAVDDGGIRFVATLAGFADNGMWLQGDGVSTASISPDGRWLAFPTARKLTAYNNGGHVEVYVYDAQDGTLACASCPPDGRAATGDARLQEVSIFSAGTLTPRNFADDGRLYFDSPEPLAAGDDDTATDVYERAPDGTLTLISRGITAPAGYVDNGADGRDVFVRTTATLTGGDTDGGLADIYDARVGGGFPEPAAPTPCSGESCRAAQTPPPAAPAIGSATAFDDGGPLPSSPATTFKVKAITAAARRSWARTGRMVLKVAVSDSAEVSVRGRGTIGAKKATVASGTAMREGAGTVSVTVRLTTAARRALRRAHRLTVALTVTCSDTTRASRATVVLRSGSSKAGR
jgi:hypothetical protein